jgi:hypothetical protein
MKFHNKTPISGKTLLHDGWGDNITQNSIYNVNGKLMK